MLCTIWDIPDDCPSERTNRCDPNKSQMDEIRGNVMKSRWTTIECNFYQTSELHKFNRQLCLLHIHFVYKSLYGHLSSHLPPSLSSVSFPFLLSLVQLLYWTLTWLLLDSFMLLKLVSCDVTSLLSFVNCWALCFCVKLAHWEHRENLDLPWGKSGYTSM